jgi:hypothetical protein
MPGRDTEKGTHQRSQSSKYNIYQIKKLRMKLSTPS